MKVTQSNDAPGQHECPSRGINKQRVTPPQMPLPIGGSQLVSYQPIGGLRVWDTQQRFGETHQHHTLLAG